MVAIVDARLALTAHQDHDYERPNDPAINHADLSFLRKAFDAAKAEPVRLYPHLEPSIAMTAAANQSPERPHLLPAVKVWPNLLAGKSFRESG
jgi:hypothetical protein